VSPSIDLTDARRVTSALSCSIREGVRVGSSRSMPDSPLAANQRSVASRSAGVVAITSTRGSVAGSVAGSSTNATTRHDRF